MRPQLLHSIHRALPVCLCLRIVCLWAGLHSSRQVVTCTTWAKPPPRRPVVKSDVVWRALDRSARPQSKLFSSVDGLDGGVRHFKRSASSDLTVEQGVFVPGMGQILSVRPAATLYCRGHRKVEILQLASLNRNWFSCENNCRFTLHAPLILGFCHSLRKRDAQCNPWELVRLDASLTFPHNAASVVSRGISNFNYGSRHFVPHFIGDVVALMVGLYRQGQESTAVEERVMPLMADPEDTVPRTEHVPSAIPRLPLPRPTERRRTGILLKHPRLPYP